MADSPLTAVISTATATASTTTSGTDSDLGATTTTATLTSTTTLPHVLGPLTTTFTAPTQCSQQYWGWTSDEWYGPLMGQVCAIEYGTVAYAGNTNCLPPVTRYYTTVVGSGSTAETAGIMDAGYYSPGIACPAGYATACAVHAGADAIPSALSTFQSFEFAYQPTAEETVIGCCPSGYQCQTTSTSQWCQTIIATTTQALVSCVNVSNTAVASTTMFALPTTTTTSGKAVTFDTLSLAAFMVQINYQATDLPSTSSSLSSTPATSSISPETTTGTSSGGGSSHKATTIAVAVVIPCVALIAAGLAWFYYRKVYQARKSSKASTSYYPDGSVPMEIAGNPAPFEVAGSVPRFEMAGSDPRHELYAGDELPRNHGDESTK